MAGTFVVLVAVKEISPVPDPAAPMFVLELVQLYTVFTIAIDEERSAFAILFAQYV